MLRSCLVCLQSSGSYTWRTCQLPRISREILVFDENYVSALTRSFVRGVTHFSAFACGWCITLSSGEFNVFMIAIKIMEIVPHLFLYFELYTYLYSAYAAHYVYFTTFISLVLESLPRLYQNTSLLKKVS